jgi:hypothetical protein
MKDYCKKRGLALYVMAILALSVVIFNLNSAVLVIYAYKDPEKVKNMTLMGGPVDNKNAVSHITLPPTATTQETKIGPPTNGVYQSAFADFGGEEDQVTGKKITDYENMVDKKIVWAYFSNNWGSGIKFPEESVRMIHSFGIVPFIRMMPRTDFNEGKPDPIYTLQGFIEGKFDIDLKRWAQDAKRVGIPIMVEFGTEVNGGWFPWSGILNGGGKTDGYGDPNYPDGPERFRDAYRHIIDLFRKEGVRNITWAFHVFAPKEIGDRIELQQSWNNIRNYYAGDNYIDWIGISIYGADQPHTEWKSFSQILDTVYQELAAISKTKPLAVFEFGTLEDPQQGNKTQWIKDALHSIESGRYARIKAISYWDEKFTDDKLGTIDLRLNSSPQTAEVYREIISSSFFVSKPAYVLNGS